MVVRALSVIVVRRLCCVVSDGLVENPIRDIINQINPKSR
jgi:hypothetical protein